ncbi:MAG: hypothetical protein ACOYN0_00695 [Phycisphaerales bacterium]
MSKLFARVILPTLLVATCAGLTACAGTSRHPGHSAVSSDLTPDLMGLYSRPIDKNNSYTLTTNTNWRLFWDDLGRASLLDRPSRLNAVPITH